MLKLAPIMIPLLVILIWEAARVIREHRQLQKERQEVLAAEALAAVNRRPYFQVEQPDGQQSLCRPVEEDYFVQHVKSRKPRIKSRIKSCFCMGPGHSQSYSADREEWRVAEPRLVQ